MGNKNISFDNNDGNIIGDMTMAFTGPDRTLECKIGR